MLPPSPARGPRRIPRDAVTQPVPDAVTQPLPAVAPDGPEAGRPGTDPAVPSAGEGPETGTRSSRIRSRRVHRRILIALVIAVVGAPAVLFAVGWLIFAVPSPDEATLKQISTISYADGSPMVRLVPKGGNRVRLPLQAIPPHVRDAVLAAEDRTFYTNPGFDLTGIVRAVGKQLTGGSGGGSTITQQYVKNVLVGNEFSLTRKYRELIVAVKVTQQLPKDEILRGYLNTIYFGRGAYGIETASQAYFAKPASQLTVSEGALLAGLIQSPTNWDPARAPDDARRRWEFVMDGLLDQDRISPGERRAARFPPTVAPSASTGWSSLDGENGHIADAVRAELSALGVDGTAIARQGLRVTTTIDPSRQRELVEAVREQVAGQPEDLRSAAVAIDPATGGISAYYGGDKGLGTDYAQVLKQPGMTFTPFAVLAGLLSDPPVDTRAISSSPGGATSCTVCDLRQALATSDTGLFSRLANLVGPPAVVDAARKAGITAVIDAPDASVALGVKEVTPLQLASAYATLAAGGVYHPPHLVSTVVDVNGNVLYQRPERASEYRFSPETARAVAETMMSVPPLGGFELPQGQQAAVQPGTVGSRTYGQSNDAWFAGFTPVQAAVVWIGSDRNVPLLDQEGTPVTGIGLPSALWYRYMAGAVLDLGKADFPTFGQGDPDTGEPDLDASSPTGGTGWGGCPEVSGSERC
ncbi:Multimodular transpeptidase-transglycosylase [Pseudonocardia sp. Ae717_Ps2]|nr:Multimodular transpeptidase-transglycosylase [Pseudonocardia sp. Ae717_Ps2]